MKKIILFAALVAVSAPAMAQKAKKQSKTKTETGKQPEAVAQDNPQERQERVAMIEQRMLGPMHNLLIQWAGHWRDEMKVWANVKSEPTINMIERDGRIMAEGRFLISNIMGQIGNARYEAQSVLGYDNAKKVFVKTWFDNFGTSILVLEGTYDEKANIINFVGTTTDPLTRMPVKVHQILRILSPESQMLEVFIELKEGKEFKTMEIKSTRG